MTAARSINTLIHVLDGQRDCYAALLQLAETKRRALITDDLHALEHTLEQEQVLITTLGRLERERLETGTYLAREMSVPADMLTLDVLASKADPSLQERLATLRTEIVSQIQRLKEINQVNGQLIDQALRVINASLQALGGSSQQPTTYGPGTAQQAARGEKANARFLDRKV